MTDEMKALSKSLSLVGFLGLTVIVTIGLFFLAGMYLDEALGTGSVFLVVFLFSGVALSFWNSYRIIMKSFEKDQP